MTARKTPVTKKAPMPAAKVPRQAGGSGSGVEALHAVKAGQPVTYETSGHPKRADSPTYKRSRAALMKIWSPMKGWYFGNGPYQDHHGGGLWVHDDRGWFFVRNLVGIEWSGQFCADPKKVDTLRQNAARLYARFPESFDAFTRLGVDLKKLLETPITDANGVSQWTDSVCNASVPLPQPHHTGAVPKGGGVHNYPTPVTDIDRFKRDDFTLWVTDAEGQPAAVVPRYPIGHADRSVRVIHATAGTALHKQHEALAAQGRHHELPATHSLALQAFKRVKSKPASKR